MKVFEEEKIVYEGETDIECCPECGESGCLMDLPDEDFLEDLIIEQQEQM
jgi:hypothetical protein